MIRRWGMAAFVGLVVASGFACSSNDSGDDDDDFVGGDTDSGLADGAVGDFVTQYCAALASCCTALALPSDASVCKRGLDFGEHGHDPAAERTCLAAVAGSESTNPSWCTAQTRDDQYACAQAAFAIERGEPTRGTLGGACVGSLSFSRVLSTSASASGPVCYEIDGLACRIVGSDPAKCVQLAAIGQPCNDDANDPLTCVYDAYCGATGTCKAFANLGESCGSDAACNDSYTCTGGVCSQRSSEGAACSSNDDCTSELCNEPTDGGAPRCERGVALWGIGAGYCSGS